MTATEDIPSNDGRRRVHIGPAGWSYRDWIGPVYPASGKTDQLLFIARYMNCIELNSSFYRVPGERLVRSWERRIAGVEGFLFTVKALQRFTHERIIEDDQVRGFLHAFDPLLEAGRIGAFLLQFPWSFKNTAESRAYVVKLGGYFNEYPTVVEFRHASWNRADTVGMLTDHGLSFCNIDQPQIGASLPPTEYVTDPRAGYIRLHGRNRKDWFREGAGRDARYDYLYTPTELEGWRERAERIMAKVRRLFIITNNHFGGQALVNALQLKSMLARELVDAPRSLVEAYTVLGEVSRPFRSDDLFDE